MVDKYTEIQQKYGLDYKFVDCQMFCKYLSGDEKILIAGDYNGYNSLVINEILKNQENMVTLEPCEIFSTNVHKIRDDNSLTYVIGTEQVCCDGACNMVKQYKEEWHYVTVENIIRDHNDSVNYSVTKETRKQINCHHESMSFAAISTKYNIAFDTIFTNGLNCFFLLSDTPEENFLSGINTIFLQGMCSIMPHVKKVIYQKLTESNFEKIESINGTNVFSGEFAVWRKIVADPNAEVVAETPVEVVAETPVEVVAETPVEVVAE